MQDITATLLDVASSDATLLGILGGELNGDTRIYQFYEGDANIDATTLPAYITISLVANPEARAAVDEPVYTFAIWARSVEVVEAARDRLMALFNKKRFTTGVGRGIYVKKVNESQSFVQQPNFSGKTLHFRAGWSTV